MRLSFNWNFFFNQFLFTFDVDIWFNEIWICLNNQSSSILNITGLFTFTQNIIFTHDYWIEIGFFPILCDYWFLLRQYFWRFHFIVSLFWKRFINFFTWITFIQTSRIWMNRGFNLFFRVYYRWLRRLIFDKVLMKSKDSSNQFISLIVLRLLFLRFRADLVFQSFLVHLLKQHCFDLKLFCPLYKSRRSSSRYFRYCFLRSLQKLLRLLLIFLRNDVFLRIRGLLITFGSGKNSRNINNVRGSSTDNIFGK